jgi:hypothetical protein
MTHCAQWEAGFLAPHREAEWCLRKSCYSSSQIGEMGLSYKQVRTMIPGSAYRVAAGFPPVSGESGILTL